MAGTVLEQLSYGIARGVVRAWFDELHIQQTAEREVADLPSDSERARRFRDAVERLRRGDGDPGPQHPASGGG